MPLISAKVTQSETTGLVLIAGGSTGATGATGATGSAGITGTVRGAYNAGTTYTAGPPPDVVLGSNGHWYVSLTSGNIGHDPTTDGGVHWADEVPGAVVLDTSSEATSPVAPTSAPRNRALRDFVSVLDYGTYTSGDMSSVLQASLTDALAKGKKLYVPGHVYAHNVKLTVNANGMMIEGDGPGSSVLKLTAGSNCNQLRVNTTGDGTGATRLVKFGMAGITFNHQGALQTDQGSGIEGCLAVFAVDDVWIDECEFLNVRNGGLQVYAGTDVHVRDNLVDTVIYSLAGNGIDVAGSTGASGADLEVIGNTVRNGSTNSQALDIYVGANASRTSIVGNRCIGVSNDGLLVEMANVANSSVDVSIIGNQVSGKTAVGIGILDTKATSIGPKARNVTMQGNTSNACFTGMSITGGSNVTAVGNTIDAYTGQGIALGSGSLDYDESGFHLIGNTITAGASATGAGVFVSKTGAITNLIHDISMVGNTIIGSTTNTYGIHLQGRIKTVEIVANTIRNNGSSGIRGENSSGVAPTDVILTSNNIRNNNQASRTSGNSEGISIESACSGWLVENNRATDDQGSPTQTFGLHSLSATRLTIRNNDFRGNLSGAKSVAFDSLTIYRGNKEVDAAYQGKATLVAGTVTVSTAAVNNTTGTNGNEGCLPSVYRISAGGTPGALYVSTVTNGTSFVITSTSGTDTSVVGWTIE